jgi:hypothetical protein
VRRRARRHQSRLQTGYVFRKGSFWYLRYYDHEVHADGTLTKVQKCHQFGGIRRRVPFEEFGAGACRRVSRAHQQCTGCCAPLAVTSTPAANCSSVGFCSSLLSQSSSSPLVLVAVVVVRFRLPLEKSRKLDNHPSYIHRQDICCPRSDF